MKPRSPAHLLLIASTYLCALPAPGQHPIATNATIAASLLHGPRGLAFDPDGDLCVAEAGTGDTVSTAPSGSSQAPPPVGPYLGGTGQLAALHVELDDYVGLKGVYRRDLSARNIAILATAGISATVDVCGPEDAIRCQTAEPALRKVVVQLMPAPRRDNSVSNFRRLGVSITDGRGGSYAEAFVVPVKDEAAEVGLPWIVLLAYVAAHEEGHILLGTRAHTATGLMKARWNARDYVDMSRGSLLFSSQQIEGLRRACGHGG
jgi:hypothetical protein